MSMSPRGKLIYGYALGGREDGALIAEIDDEGDWQTEWARALATDPKRAHEDPDAFYYIEQVLRDAGVEIGDDRTLKLISYGHLEYGHCRALVTYEAAAEWSEATPVDLAALETMRQAQGWDALLAQAIDVLGITPVTMEKEGRWDYNAPRVPVPPRWMVVAQYI
jgi:hypothetical protein